ncbi:uncharacterized protein LOC109711993 isoform X2 [Ananas comosus]|uniref:Uncharacterized protein LOC109711993 isoform X2 n=1 Tax=Ananas comosus TaxID=4615 RepID=A0A6P5FC12_ANACO|nr:uncharacterized protein LOC109711993 isoform X2 [Ananas comosus]
MMMMMMMLHRQLSAPHPMTLAGARGRCELNDELRVKATELERRFADYKLRIGADGTGPAPRRGEIRGGTCADADGTCGGEERRRRRRRRRRGELYGAYMERRDARLREGWRTRMEEKEAQMKAMWESLERSRAEMAARFGRSRSHNVEKREISESSAEKKTHDLATPPRSTPSKRFSFSSIASSSTPRSSITQVSRHSFSDSTKRMMQPESPLAQSASAVSSPNRKNRTPSTGNNTANSMPRSRILTRSMSSISNSEGRTAPRSVSSRSEMKRGTESKPFLRRGSGIGAGAGAAMAKPRNCNVFETTANEEETTEMVDQCDIVSDREKDNNKDCPRLSGHDSGGENSSLSQELYNDVEPVSGNGKANGNKVEELSGESSRSWYSNISSSFSNQSGIVNLLDSPVGSPPPSISQSVEQLREAELTRVRKKKREIAEKQIVASTNPQSPKDVARGLKRFLNFGRRSKGSEGLASECASALVNSHVDEDIEYEPNTVKNCPLNDLSKSKDGAFASGFNDQRNGHANSLEVLLTQLCAYFSCKF